jgi:hypothetical protein
MATYYWRGGSGTWNGSSTTNWSNASGGAGGFGPPTSSDAVIFDSASSGAGYTVQVGSTSVCASITATAPATGNITFSNTTANDGSLFTCGSSTASVSTGLNIYNGAIFTKGATPEFLYLRLYCYNNGGTATITFNNSGAATQPIFVDLAQGSNGAFSNTVNFCNGHTQTFSTVRVMADYGSGFTSSTTYNTFNCTSATITISGSSGSNTEYFGFGFNSAFTGSAYQFGGNIVLTSTSITIGAASSSASASYGGAFYIVGEAGNISWAGASISILRVPTSASYTQYYFYISPSYTLSNNCANITLSNGVDIRNSSSYGYYNGFGNLTGLTGNLVISNTVASAGGLTLYAAMYTGLGVTIGQTFTVSGTTTITGAAFELNGLGLGPYSFSIVHTGAVSLVGNSFGLCTYGSNVYGTSVTFSSTLTSTNPTAVASALHSLYLLYSAITVVGNVSLVDTYIVAYTATTTGASNTWTHGTVNGFAGNGAQLFRATFTKGLTTLTNATYNLTEDTSTQQFAALTLNGSIISCTAQYGGSNSISTTGNVILGSYSTTTLSTIRLLSAGSISITGTLTSTNAGSVASAHTITTNSGNLSISSTTSLVDTVVNVTGTTNAVQWTQTKTASGTTTGSNVFGGNATFTGNTAFTNSDVVFLGQTNSVTGTFSFTVTSAAVVVSTGSYATNDNPAITFLYDGASTFSVSSSFTVTGATTNRTNVRTFVPYAGVQEPTDLKYNQVTISVASVSLSYVNFQNVTASGATPWTGTALGNATGNNNITFPAAATRFLVASSGTVQSNTAIWANSSGGATSINNYPLPQDTIAVDNNSASVGAVVVNFASVVYATNVIGQASINRSVTFSRSGRSSLVLLGNLTLFTPAAGGLVFDLLNVTLTNASSASAHVLSWPTGYAPLAAGNSVPLYLYSLGSMTLSGSTSSSAPWIYVNNTRLAPSSGTYGSFTITEGIDVYVYTFNVNYNGTFNFTSAIIYAVNFIVEYPITVSAYTVSSASDVPDFLGSGLVNVIASYIGNLKLLQPGDSTVGVSVPSIGNLTISTYNPSGPGFTRNVLINNCTVGNMTGGGTSGLVVTLSQYGGSPTTITKTGGGFIQLNSVYINTLNAAPANTFYATNSSLIGPATGWTLTAAPGGAAGGNFFLEF